MFQNKLAYPQHLSDEALIRYLDGELPAAEAADTKGHLEACWSCRGRAEELERTVLQFLDYQKLAIARLGEPPRHWGGFSTRLRQQAAELASQGKRSSLSLWVRWEAALAYFLKPQRAMAIATSILMVCWLFYSDTRVTASEVFARAESSEAQTLNAYSHPVIHQTIQVQKKSGHSAAAQAVNLEIWNDMRHRLVRRTADSWSSLTRNDGAALKVMTKASLAGHSLESPPVVVSELQHIYQLNHLDWGQPLSPSAFRAWSAENTPNAVEVKHASLPNGENSLTLSASAGGSTAVGGIEAADLVVRTSDWHPVAERVRVKGETGDQVYELSELNFEVVNLNVVNAAIFQLPTEPVLPLVATRIIAAPPSSLSSSELEATEMSARWALHQIKADLGEPVEILRKTNEIEVRALADSSKRQSQMESALEGIPHLAVDINTIQQLSQSQDKTRARTNGSPALSSNTSRGAAPMTTQETSIGSEIVSGRLPIEDQLVAYFSSHLQTSTETGRDAAAPQEQENVQARIQKLSNQALAFSDAALSEAWALRRLAKRYPADEISKLPPQSRNQLDDLIRDHLRNIREDVTQGRSLLQPVLSSLLKQSQWEENAGGTGKVLQGSLPATWPEFPSPLFDIVNYMDRITTGLFAGTGFPIEDYERLAANKPLRTAPPEKYMADLLSSYSLLEDQLSSVEKQVSTHSIDHR